MPDPTGCTAVNLIHRIGFAALLSPVMAGGLSAAFREAHADEGTVWLLDPEGTHLVASHNTGADAEKIVGFKQPLGKGLISMVFETEQAFCENDIQRNTIQDKRLDLHVGKSTTALIAVPFVVRGEICGVISCVKLDFGGAFTGTELDRIMRAEITLQQALERALDASPP